ncbi:hypothetical protein A5662_24295 [Mycobacteriaceae bacterium 1482268.1]|nr:hypothetical protein A5662_24295 [Mycobacteriaceae bacterium 1482268.1]
MRLVRSLDSTSGIDAGAVRLFVERAEGIAPGFSMTDADDTAAVVEICQRVDGIPLAIELAAARMASMTVSEMRDRLDHRFRLLVGSRRGLERHHTLRHAVAWSYDLLDDTEKTVLKRCSVFAGGFDLQSACAVAESNDIDEYGLLDVLDALVRKSLVLADRSLRRTRFSMLETIRQFAEEQLVARDDATEIRTAHSRHFAQREADIMALWDSPQQREAYEWFTVELANLRTAFQWAADHNDLDVAVSIASYTGFLGLCTENYEPSGWAEELIEPARATDHPRLAALYAVASQCYLTGRLDEGCRYSDAAQTVLTERRDVLPPPIDAMIGGAYMYSGHPERCITWCRAQLECGRDTVHIRSCLVFGLVHAGSLEEAMAATNGLIGRAEATSNPFMVSFALFAYSYAFREADPGRALDAARRGLVIAQNSGNRLNETQLAITLGRLEATHGDIASAFDHLSLAIRNTHDSGDTGNTTMAALAAFFDRLGRYAPAATISGFALSPLTALATPEITIAIAHLRDILGDQAYESIARKGAAMTTAEMVSYAFDQIDQARAELTGVSK